MVVLEWFLYLVGIVIGYASFRFNGWCIFSAAGTQTQSQCHTQKHWEDATPDQMLHDASPFSEASAAAAAPAAAFAVGTAAA